MCIFAKISLVTFSNIVGFIFHSAVHARRHVRSRVRLSIRVPLEYVHCKLTFLIVKLPLFFFIRSLNTVWTEKALSMRATMFSQRARFWLQISSGLCCKFALIWLATQGALSQALVIQVYNREIIILPELQFSELSRNWTWDFLRIFLTSTEIKWLKWVTLSFVILYTRIWIPSLTLLI